MAAGGTPLRWGIIGLGWVSTDFMGPALLKCPGSQITACLGTSREKGEAFARRFGVARVHESLAAMVADRAVDAIYVATPNAIHQDAVVAAARAGKHVLCEKPFAMTLDDARAMIDACASAGVILRVAHQMRCEEVLVRAREVVQSGRLGRIAAVSLERASANPPRNTWRKDWAQSGVIFDVGVHLLDQISWITGQRFTEVSAFTVPDRRLSQPDDQVTVLARLDGDCHAVVRATRHVGSAENNLIVEGSDATLITSALRFVNEHTLTIRDKSGKSEVLAFPASPAYELEAHAFEDEIRGKRSLLPSGEECLHTVATTLAVLTAVLERRVVAVENV